MKRIILFSVALLLIASASYAPCFYPMSRHEDYWQYHISCAHNPCRAWDPYVDWWSLDGQCDLDCNGSYYCSGDTHVDSRTMIDVTVGDCDPICE